MRVSNVLPVRISFSQKQNLSKNNVVNFSKSQIKNENDEFVPNRQHIRSIFGFKEIEKLYEFAQKHRNDNIAVEITGTPLIDCKLVKTQKDLNNNTGKWLDITDYDFM